MRKSGSMTMVHKAYSNNIIINPKAKEGKITNITKPADQVKAAKNIFITSTNEENE